MNQEEDKQAERPSCDNCLHRNQNSLDFPCPGCFDFVMWDKRETDDDAI